MRQAKEHITVPSTSGSLQQLPTSPSPSPDSHPPFHNRLTATVRANCVSGPYIPPAASPTATDTGFPQYSDKARTVGECCVARRHTMNYIAPAFDGDACFTWAVWHTAWMLGLRYLGLLSLISGLAVRLFKQSWRILGEKIAVGRIREY